MQLAKQGFTRSTSRSTTPTGTRRRTTPSPARTATTRCASTTTFMKAVENDGPWHLYWRTEKEKAAEREPRAEAEKTLKARDLWDQIAFAAWACADPGVQFDTTINEWHTCPADGRINATNPCSEYIFLDDTACNLASLNLLKFYDTPTGTFDVDSYRHAMPALDADPRNLRLHGPVPQRAGRPEVVRLPHARPRLRQPRRAAHGAGHPLRLGRRPGPVRRPSPPSCTPASYATSAEIAAEVGPFPRYEANRDAMLRVVRNHRRAAYNAAAGRVRGADHHARRHRRRATARRTCSRPPAASPTGCWSSARSTATATPRSRSSPRPAPSAWSWTATPPASSRTSPW